MAQRLNRTLIVLVRTKCYAIAIWLSRSGKALSVAVHVRNRVTTRGLKASPTPYEVLFNCKPHVRYRRVFGSRCWYKENTQRSDKLDSRAVEATMIGYSRGPQGYKLWDYEQRTVVVSRDVNFDERIVSENGTKDRKVAESRVLQNDPSTILRDDVPGPTAEAQTFDGHGIIYRE